MTENPPQPPRAPPMERRVTLSPLQRWGIPLLTLIPLLALFGVMGVTSERVTEAGAALALEVEYPTRSRRGVTAGLTVTVRNGGQAAAQGVVVSLDRAYIDSFDEFAVRPAVTGVDAASYRVDVGAIPPGESRMVSATLTAGRYWRQPGSVSVSAAGDAPSLTADFATFTFP